MALNTLIDTSAIEVLFEKSNALESRLASLEEELQALRTTIATPPDCDAPFNTARECAEGACSYHDLYLATGPATMSHAAYHQLEAEAAKHFEQCKYPGGKRCPIYSDFETRLHA